MTVAYYNENDPFAAQWLRNLIDAGLIAWGDVDERDIRDVEPDDLDGYTQLHFFAGIGAWSYALRLSGWPDDRPVFTGSCPCQPFSAAGRGLGFADERHLWPAWCHLIQQCRPPIVFGEQVASTDGKAWFDLVHVDLEGMDYAVGAGVLPVAGLGAPHPRHRLWFVADSDGGHASAARQQRSGQHGQQPQDGGAGRVGDAQDIRQPRPRLDRARAGYEPQQPDGPSPAHILGNAERQGLEEQREQQARREQPAAQRAGPTGRVVHADSTPAADALRSRGLVHGGAGASRGPWSPVEWLPCIDGKARPVEPGTFPLANGIAGRMGRLRGYGNAISPWIAAEFIAAYREARGEEVSTAYDLIWG